MPKRSPIPKCSEEDRKILTEWARSRTQESRLVGILSRKALKGASFQNVEQLRQAIEAFISAYNPAAKPFRWRKREVKGSQLRNTFLNFCN